MKTAISFSLVIGLLSAGGGRYAGEGGPCMATLKPPQKKSPGARFVELKGAKWQTGQTLRILFMGGTAEEHAMVREAASEWTKYANLNFEFYESRTSLGGKNSDIRITFDKTQGSHSALGIHATYYGQDESTMNFGWNSKSTIMHEFGHALGLKHEHQNPSAGIPWNKPLVYAYFAKQSWTKEMVDRNVFEQLDVNTVNFTKYDKNSIMVYEFPAEWTTNGTFAKRGETLSAVDKAGIAKMYPGRKPGSPPVATTEPQVAPATQLPAVTPATVKPTPPSAAAIREDDLVACNGRRGKVVRTIGDNLLIDFEDGKRDYAKQGECQRQ